MELIREYKIFNIKPLYYYDANNELVESDYVYSPKGVVRVYDRLGGYQDYPIIEPMFNIPQLKIVFFSSIKTATDLMKLIGDNNKFAIGVQYFYNISRKDKRIFTTKSKDWNISHSDSGLYYIEEFDNCIWENTMKGLVDLRYIDDNGKIKKPIKADNEILELLRLYTSTTSIELDEDNTTGRILYEIDVMKDNIKISYYIINNTIYHNIDKFPIMYTRRRNYPIFIDKSSAAIWREDLRKLESGETSYDTLNDVTTNYGMCETNKIQLLKQIREYQIQQVIALLSAVKQIVSPWINAGTILQFIKNKFFGGGESIVDDVLENVGETTEAAVEGVAEIVENVVK